MNKEQFEKIGKGIRENPQIMDSLDPLHRYFAEKIWANEGNKSESNKN